MFREMVIKKLLKLIENPTGKVRANTAPQGSSIISLFAWSYLAYKSLLISQRIVFFSHTKPANSTFSHCL